MTELRSCCSSFTLLAFALLLSACLVHQGATADNSSEKQQQQLEENRNDDEKTIASGAEDSIEEDTIEGDDQEKESNEKNENEQEVGGDSDTMNTSRELKEDEQGVVTNSPTNPNSDSKERLGKAVEEVKLDGRGTKKDQETEDEKKNHGKVEKQGHTEDQKKEDAENKENQEENQEQEEKLVEETKKVDKKGKQEEEDQKKDPEDNNSEEMNEELEEENQEMDQKGEVEKADQGGGQEENQEGEEPQEKQESEITSQEEDEIIVEEKQSAPEYNVAELTRVHVSCGHVRRLLHVDSTAFGVGAALDECWHRGVSLADLALNVSFLEQDREDIEQYNLGELYLPCDRVFRDEVITKLTTSLLEDFLRCEKEAALSEEQAEIVRHNFAEILNVYEKGNASLTIEEDTLASCRNISKRITMLCRQFGLTEGQWSQGFLRYGFDDKWAVEEELGELSLTCDRVFDAGLERELYDEPARVFLKCLDTMTISDELRDQLEKKYADELLQLRAAAADTSDQPMDLRAYVSCKHVQPVRLRNGPASASWVALDVCKRRGRNYAQIMGETEETDVTGSSRREDDEDHEVDVTDLYLPCKDVFNDELWSLSTPLLNDYESCKRAGAIKESAMRLIRKRFSDVFKLIAENRRPKASNVTERLVSCEGFVSKLAELCRERGSSLAQELRGTGSPARALGPTRWINCEPLEKLYVHCDDVFDEYARHLAKLRIPVERYSQCRWAPGISKAAQNFIEKRINKVYVKPPPRNSTGYEITELVVFDLNSVPNAA